MKPVVYIDTLFLINLIFNMLIFYMSAYVLKKDTGAKRIFFVSVLGAIYGVLVFFPELGILYTGASKVLFMVLSAKLLFSPVGIRALMRESIMCFFVSLCFSGTIICCLFFTGASRYLGMVISKGVIYLDIDPLILLFGVMLSLVLIIFFSEGTKKSFNKSDIINEFIISAGGESFLVKALSDTGCTLYDPSGSFPALIVEKGLIPKELGDIKRVTLKYSSITKEDESLEGFFPDSVTDKEEKVLYRAIVCEGKENLDRSGRFNAVVNPAIFSLSYREEPA